MARKQRKKRTKTDAAWKAAADAAGVSVGELSDWVREHPQEWHHTQWSQWATGTKIPERIIILFLRDRLAECERWRSSAVPTLPRAAPDQ